MLNLSPEVQAFADRIPQIYNIIISIKSKKQWMDIKFNFNLHDSTIIWVCYDLVCKEPILDSRLAKVDWSVDMFSCKETCS